MSVFGTHRFPSPVPHTLSPHMEYPYIPISHTLHPQVYCFYFNFYFYFHFSVFSSNFHFFTHFHTHDYHPQSILSFCITFIPSIPFIYFIQSITLFHLSVYSYFILYLFFSVCTPIKFTHFYTRSILFLYFIHFYQSCPTHQCLFFIFFIIWFLVYLFPCLFVGYLSVYLFSCLSVCFLLLCLFFCQFVLFGCLFDWFVCLFACLFVCLG